MFSAWLVPLQPGSWLMSIFAGLGAVPSNLTVPFTVATVAGSMGVAAGAEVSGALLDCSVFSFLLHAASAKNAHNASMLTNRVTRSAFLFMMSPFLKFIKSSAGNCADVGTGISDRAADCLQNARTIHKLAILTRTAIDGMMRFHGSLFAIA